MSNHVAAVRIPLWRGVQPVVALWFPADAPKGDAPKDRMSHADARAARMLAHWRTGAKAQQFVVGAQAQKLLTWRWGGRCHAGAGAQAQQQAECGRGAQGA